MTTFRSYPSSWASFAILAIGLMVVRPSVARASVCPDVDRKYAEMQKRPAVTGAAWVELVKEYLDCKRSRARNGILTDEDTKEIYAESINIYGAAVKSYEAEADANERSYLELEQKHAVTDRQLSEAKKQMDETEQKLVETERQRDGYVKLLEQCPRGGGTAVQPGDTPGIERFSLRFETGYSAGRLTRSVSQTQPSHSGGFLQLSLLPRFTFARAPLIAVLFGPYYAFWRGIDKTIDVRLSDARVHSFGGKLELGIKPGKRVKNWLSLHPSLELGMDYVRFDFNYQHPVDVGYVDERYSDMTGFVIAGNLNTCVWHAAFCLGLRLRSVPGERSLPTTQVTFGFDLVRLIAGLRE